VRFIGDRSIQEKDFGRIQIDRIAEMQKWAGNIKKKQNLLLGRIHLDLLGIVELQFDLFPRLILRLLEV
jgi:hypothetical protein